LASKTSVAPVLCDNPWCGTKTRSHMSAFAKRRCDQSKGAQVRVHASQVATQKHSSRQSADEAQAVFGGDTEQGTVGYSTLRDGHFEGAVFDNVVLAEAQGANFEGATFGEVVFDGGVIECSFAGASGFDVRIQKVISDTRMDDMRVAGLHVESGTEVRDLSVSGALINDSTWGRHSDVKDSSFRFASMRRSTFGESIQFRNCDFTGVDLARSEFAGSYAGKSTFSSVIIERANFSGVDLTNVTFADVPLAETIYFVDGDTLPMLNPGTLDPSDFGREFMTRALTDEQYSDFVTNLGASEAEVRGAMSRLSPAFVPVYEDGAVGTRGELLRRAMLGDDVGMLTNIQAELWDASRPHNRMLVESPDALYS